MRDLISDQGMMLVKEIPSQVTIKYLIDRIPTKDETLILRHGLKPLTEYESEGDYGLQPLTFIAN